jgi:hypothetical protein
VNNAVKLVTRETGNLVEHRQLGLEKLELTLDAVSVQSASDYDEQHH